MSRDPAFYERQRLSVDEALIYTGLEPDYFRDLCRKARVRKSNLNAANLDRLMGWHHQWRVLDSNPRPRVQIAHGNGYTPEKYRTTSGPPSTARRPQPPKPQSPRKPPSKRTASRG